MVNWLNENYDKHIITLEDPIEYYFSHKKSTVNQREIGVDVPSFKEGIRRGLRMDPDVILVGEMRDLETIHAAIDRIIDVFPKEQQDQVRTQLSTALIGVLSQTLLPRKPEGLVAAYEMMVITPAIQNLIRENKVYRIDSSIQTGRKHGMFLLDESLFKLWRDGLVDKEEVLGRSSKPAELAAKISAAEKGIYDDEEYEDDDEEDEDDDEEDEDDDDR
jgi:twitching motility protein PilT